jgi:hypothetical protein
VFDLSRVARWQNQKRAAVLAFVAASCTLLLCSLILSVPSLDDALSGRPEYLTLLHWKTHADPALLARAGNAQLRQAMPPSMSVLPVDMSLPWAELREAVARRHNNVNAVLRSSCPLA